MITKIQVYETSFSGRSFLHNIWRGSEHICHFDPPKTHLQATWESKRSKRRPLSPSTADWPWSWSPASSNWDTKRLWKLCEWARLSWSSLLTTLLLSGKRNYSSNWRGFVLFSYEIFKFDEFFKWNCNLKIIRQIDAVL